MRGFICVFILLSVSLTCYGKNYGINEFWNSMMYKFFSKSDGQKSTEDDRTKSNNQYWLYTRDNPLKGQQIIMNDEKSILSSNMRSTKDTTFVIHGWLGDYADKFNVNLTSALLHNNDVNVICVDWSALSHAFYMTSVNSVPEIGTAIGDFINWLVSLGYSFDMIHLVGHSLGAHIAGFAGRRTKEKIARITGLDPAGPAWNSRKILSSDDADYVECLHTDIKLFGTNKLCGHADFFPNGGIFMPGCGINMGCGHAKAFYYFTATTMFPKQFVGSKCKSVEDAMDCSCNGEPAVMGNNDLDKKVSGIYCLETKEDYPYF